MKGGASSDSVRKDETLLDGLSHHTLYMFFRKSVAHYLTRRLAEQSTRIPVIIALGSARRLTQRRRRRAGPTAGVPGALIGHLQRARGSSLPNLQRNVRSTMLAFDAEQQKLDEELDKSLNICRC